MGSIKASVTGGEDSLPAAEANELDPSDDDDDDDDDDDSNIFIVTNIVTRFDDGIRIPFINRS